MSNEGRFYLGLGFLTDGRSNWHGGYFGEGKRIIFFELLFRSTHQGVGNRKTSVLVFPAWIVHGTAAGCGLLNRSIALIAVTIFLHIQFKLSNSVLKFIMIQVTASPQYPLKQGKLSLIAFLSDNAICRPQVLQNV